ncbi:uncharacterized protein LOC130627577 [Hydractinia symbiolongicarpus]|uniref:uncharacterized protein LOC130627577 n=1 Tax=Hydractinia symbiolongicarpus TaxID=13093 RepID=UPI002550E468|nr:uncharacterized protein LOC130627577 [Hydractinia symbiolongicarpus]
MQPLCEEHNSPGRFVCIHCEHVHMRICIHRSDKNHERKSVAKVGEEARKWFPSFIASFAETKVILENLTKQYDESLNNLQSSREAFVRELKVRKWKRIEYYLKMINTEEENLLGELTISVSDVNVVDPYKFSVHKTMMDKTERLPSHAQLETNLKSLLDEVKGCKESFRKANLGCWKEPKIDVKPKNSIAGYKRVLQDTKGRSPCRNGWFVMGINYFRVL